MAPSANGMRLANCCCAFWKANSVLNNRTGLTSAQMGVVHKMSATILQFRPRPNPKREAEQLAQAVVNAMCWPWLAWADQFDADLYAKGLAIDTAPSEYCAPMDDPA